MSYHHPGQKRAQSCQCSDQHMALGPPKDGPASHICYEPREGSEAALLHAIDQQWLYGSPLLSCIFSCKISAPRSRCQERDLFLIQSLSLPLLNTSCVVCSHSISSNLLQSRPIPNSGQKDNAEVINVLGMVSGIQDPPHPGASSHQHHPLTCFSSPPKRKPGKNRPYSVTKRSDKP